MTPDPVRAGAKTVQALTLAATVLTLVGVVLAATQPAWLTGPLHAAVAGAGAAAPLVYVLLCALGAPLHLAGVLGALSTVIWPLPQAMALTFLGTLLGALLGVGLLSRLGVGARRYRDSWPAWLTRLSAGVHRRPLLVGVLARLALGSGAALEAFFVLTGYGRAPYLLAAVLGSALWTVQALVGVTLLRRLLQLSPALGLMAALLPLLLLGAAVALRRARRPAPLTDQATPADQAPPPRRTP